MPLAASRIVRSNRHPNWWELELTIQRQYLLHSGIRRVFASLLNCATQVRYRLRSQSGAREAVSVCGARRILISAFARRGFIVGELQTFAFKRFRPRLPSAISRRHLHYVYQASRINRRPSLGHAFNF